MNISRTKKTFVILVLSILVIGLLPGVAIVWAKVGTYSAEIGRDSESLIPLSQGEGPVARATPSNDEGQSGPENIITGQSDSSGVEVVPAAAFGHIGGLPVGNQAEGYFYNFGAGAVYNRSTYAVCMVAPLYLPPGSNITGFTVYVYDVSASDVTFYFSRSYSFGAAIDLAAVTSSGSGGIQTPTSTSIAVPLVEPEYNYQIDFCFPANSGTNIRVNGAKVTYTIQSPGIQYLPIVLKDVAPPPITLSVRNETGGTFDYKVYDSNPATGGTLLCQIPGLTNGATGLCGTFSSGGRWINLTAGGCDAPYNGPFTYPSGTCTRVVRCSPTPSVWEGVGCTN